MHTEDAEIETQRRKRICVALWAYAYEVMDDPLVDDAKFDAVCREIDTAISTGDTVMDEFFRKQFNPSTGMWILKHPKIFGIQNMYHKLTGNMPRAVLPPIETTRTQEELREIHWRGKKTFDTEKAMWLRKEDVDVAIKYFGYTWFAVRPKTDFCGYRFAQICTTKKPDERYILEPDTHVPNFMSFPNGNDRELLARKLGLTIDLHYP